MEVYIMTEKRNILVYEEIIALLKSEKVVPCSIMFTVWLVAEQLDKRRCKKLLDTYNHYHYKHTDET